MSFDYVRRCLRPDLPVRGFPHVVLLALASHANEHGQCYPSVALLAAEARIEERATQLALRTLERAGLMRIRRDEAGRRIPGPNGCNVYVLTLPAYDAHPAVPKRKRPRGKNGFHAELRGASACAPGRIGMHLHPNAPAVHGETAGGAGPCTDGARGDAPKAVSTIEADSTQETAATLVEVEEGDDSPEARWAAVVEAHDAGDGPYLTLRGASLRGEWLDKTHGEDAATVRTQLAQWRPNLPSSYGEQRAARDEAIERAAARRASDERAERHRREQQNLAQAHAEAHRRHVEQERAELGPMLPRLLAWLARGDQEAQDLGDCIDADDRARAGLTLVHAGNIDGIKRLRAALDGFPRALLERALTDPIPTTAA